MLYNIFTERSYTTSGQVTTVELAMDQQPFIMDIKLDGERLSVHIDNTVVGCGGGSNGGSGSASSSASSGASTNVTYTTPVLMYTRRRNDYSEQYAPLGELIRESVRIAAGMLHCFYI